MIFVLIFGFGFGLWRKMRSEYESEKILELELLVFVNWLFWGLAAYLFLKRQVGLYEWSGFLGAFWATWRVINRFDWDFWEWLDALMPRLVALSGIVYVILRPSLRGLTEGIVMMIIWLGLWVVLKKYRSFRWYKSGKMGVTGLLGILAWAIVQIVVAGGRPSEIYWWDISLSQVVCGFVISITLVSLYLRSGRKINLWQTKNKQ